MPTPAGRFDLTPPLGMSAPDWTALASLPQWREFWASEPVQQLMREAVKTCCENGTAEEVQFSRGVLDTLMKLERMPEKEARRRTEAKGAAVLPEQAPLVTWRQRWTNVWRALSAA